VTICNCPQNASQDSCVIVPGAHLTSHFVRTDPFPSQIMSFMHFMLFSTLNSIGNDFEAAV